MDRIPRTRGFAHRIYALLAFLVVVFLVVSRDATLIQHVARTFPPCAAPQAAPLDGDGVDGDAFGYVPPPSQALHTQGTAGGV